MENKVPSVRTPRPLLMDAAHGYISATAVPEDDAEYSSTLAYRSEAESSDEPENPFHVTINLDHEPLTEDLYGFFVGQLLASTSSATQTERAILCKMGVLLLLNYCIQICMLAILQKHVLAPAESDLHTAVAALQTSDEVLVELCKHPLASPFFMYCIQLVWWLTVQIEFEEICLRCIWWLRLPISTSVELNANEENNIEIRSVSRTVQVAYFIFVVFPKACIAAILWWFGAEWLLVTPDFENLILNAVALTFIIQIDETFFKAVTPLRTKRWLQRFRIPLPPAAHDPYDRLNHVACEIVLKILLIFAIPCLYTFVLQTAAPGVTMTLTRECVLDAH